MSSSEILPGGLARPNPPTVFRQADPNYPIKYGTPVNCLGGGALRPAAALGATTGSLVAGLSLADSFGLGTTNPIQLAKTGDLFSFATQGVPLGSAECNARIAAVVEPDSYQVIDGVNQLYGGFAYYLSTTPGMIRLGPPPANSIRSLGFFNVAVLIGNAFSPSDLLLNIEFQSLGDGVTITNSPEGAAPGAPTLQAFAIGDHVAAAGEDLAVGMPTYIKASDGLSYKALATALASSSVLGVSYGAGEAQPNLAVFAGEVTFTTAQWDAIVTGQSGGLTRGTYYYLSDATAGFLVAEPPNASPHYVMKVGLALSPTTLLVQIGTPVQISG